MPPMNFVSQGETKVIKNKMIDQPDDGIAVEMNGGNVTLEGVGVPAGGLLRTHAADSIKLKNVFSKGTPNKSIKKDGAYLVLVWDTPAKKMVWDNSGLAAYLKAHGHNPKLYNLKQGTGETLARFKCDDLHIIGVKFQAALDKDDRPIKQVAQFRHGKNHLVEDCTFIDGWPEVGRQALDNDGTKEWVMTQKVDTITFRRCTFTKWTPSHELISKSKGHGWKKIIFDDCIDPDGHKFTRTETNNKP